MKKAIYYIFAIVLYLITCRITLFFQKTQTNKNT